ncbi:DUF3558 domain-containing protein [Amycolatopsis arida]|uniref:DUF3558 domain-containing protein n=1 Tax=Amycolatopsis arida TaxID=587909 RepID=UPI001C431973|nr:DUF3558 domain-containing protein [Amycolatopsis arida]
MLTACGGEGGTARPTEQNPTTGSPTSASSPSAGGDTSAAGLDPCGLLDPAELAEFGTFSAGRPVNQGGARGCDWIADRGPYAGLGVGVDIRDAQGVDEVNDLGDGVQTGDINERPAAQTSTLGACIIALSLGENARADVSVNAGERSCEIADKVAGIVEPKLPES